MRDRPVALVLITCVVMVGANLVFTGWLFRSLCGVIGAQVEVYRAQPPSTPTGVAAETEWIRLRKIICRE